jgi:TonB family protein
MELRAEARAALAPLQTDADRGVRYAAAWALGHLRLPSDTKTDETPPRAIQKAKLEYPLDAYMKKIHGTVVLDVLVGEGGEVSHLEVRQSIPELDSAAVATLGQWKFEPGRVGGVPRASLVVMPVAFNLTVPKVTYK